MVARQSRKMLVRQSDVLQVRRQAAFDRFLDIVEQFVGRSGQHEPGWKPAGAFAGE